MNNFTFGGIDPRTDQPFAYYETVSGGMGARPTMDGISGVHTHMTNSMNTPVEALEHSYPVRVVRYSLRPNSGGAGKHRGGDGVIREMKFLTKAQVTVLSDRRKFSPYGLSGGQPGGSELTSSFAKMAAKKRCLRNSPRGLSQATRCLSKRRGWRLGTVGPSPEEALRAEYRLAVGSSHLLWVSTFPSNCRRIPDRQ